MPSHPSANLQPAGPLEPHQLLRVNAYGRDRRSLPDELSACTGSLWIDDEAGGIAGAGPGGGFRLPTRRELGGMWVVAATCCTAQRLIRTLAAPIFSHVVVDEAGQATEPECLCAISGAMREGAGVGRLVLAGDPQQLGPVLRSHIAASHGLSLSLLERLMLQADGPHHGAPAAGAAAAPLRPLGFHPAYVAMLTHNYRSHPALLVVPNARFYDNALVPAAPRASVSMLTDWVGLTPAARAVPGGFPLLFHGVQGSDLREGNSPSWFKCVSAAGTRGARGITIRELSVRSYTCAAAPHVPP